MIRTTAIAIFVLSVGVSRAEDWPAFRGPNGNGVSSEKSVPVSWGPVENVKWRAPLPGAGNGSPIVSAGKVFVTCAEEKGKRRNLYCFDAESGKQLWSRAIDFDRVEPTHGTNPYCGTTPAADGERVVIWEGSAGLHCYDFAGKKLWSRDLGEFVHMWGYGSSPVIHKGKILLHSGPGKRMFVAAFDPKTGKTLWEQEEPNEGPSGEKNQAGKPMGSWATPVVATIDGKEQVLCTMPTRVVAYDLESGEIVWWCEGIRGQRGDLAYSSILVGNGVLVAIGGYNGPAIGVRLGGAKGDVTETHRLWRNEENPQSIGSGMPIGEVFYTANAQPAKAIQCIEMKTGKELWNSRWKGGSSWGSIVLADGRMYVTTQDGTTNVFAPNTQALELLASNELGEQSNSTPAISGGNIFVRTFKHLYCIGK